MHGQQNIALYIIVIIGTVIVEFSLSRQEMKAYRGVKV
jgi:hypothetical protein